MQRFGIAALVGILFIFGCSQVDEKSTANTETAATTPTLETITLEIDGLA